ncbi:MAG: RcpC/CpaB family pilus assembly protein [Thermoleophilia bacterium]
MSDKDKGESSTRTRRPWPGNEPPDSLVFRDLLRGRTPETPRLAPTVPAGMRAVSLDLASERALNGMLVAGDRVDVVASVGDANGHVPEGGAKSPARLACTILQSLEVLHVSGGPAEMTLRHGSSDAAEGDGRVRIVLAAAPPEVERLVTAAENGAVWLALVPTDEASRARDLESPAVTDLGGKP